MADFDLIAIGGGTGGLAATRAAATSIWQSAVQASCPSAKPRAMQLSAAASATMRAHSVRLVRRRLSWARRWPHGPIWSVKRLHKTF